MQKYSVIISPNAEKDLAKLDKPIQERIKKYVQEKLEGSKIPENTVTLWKGT